MLSYGTGKCIIVHGGAIVVGCNVVIVGVVAVFVNLVDEPIQCISGSILIAIDSSIVIIADGGNIRSFTTVFTWCLCHPMLIAAAAAAVAALPAS